MRAGEMKIGSWSPARQSRIVFFCLTEKINAANRKWGY
jgi:hypothetical protein